MHKEPPREMIKLAIEASLQSPCRSKRGVVLWRFYCDSRSIFYSSGYNRPPQDFVCDGSPECKATCSRTAVHAEQAAILNSHSDIHGGEMLHVKTEEGHIIPSGGPSCVDCSKLILFSGLRGMWLYHDPWCFYDAKTFHELSLKANKLLR